MGSKVSSYYHAMAYQLKLFSYKTYSKMKQGGVWDNFWYQCSLGPLAAYSAA